MLDSEDTVSLENADSDSQFNPRLGIQQLQLRIELSTSLIDIDVFRKYFPRSLTSRKSSMHK